VLSIGERIWQTPIQGAMDVLERALVYTTERTQLRREERSDDRPSAGHENGRPPAEARNRARRLPFASLQGLIRCVRADSLEPQAHRSKRSRERFDFVGPALLRGILAGFLH
jgi:hypothetical protein